MKRNLLIILIITSGLFAAGQIAPSKDQDTDIVIQEGEPVTLNCSYDVSSEEVMLFWYRQSPNRALQFILRKGARQLTSNYIPDDRFLCTTSRYSTELTVRELTLADTALYFCAFDQQPQPPRPCSERCTVFLHCKSPV
uniref:Ig-like domain-containing protein n=1 Tax=Pygocentrus nattereri TaxID=42514 RepID=A0A3B4DCB2_PYGNA